LLQILLLLLLGRPWRWLMLLGRLLLLQDRRLLLRMLLLLLRLLPLLQGRRWLPLILLLEMRWLLLLLRLLKLLLRRILCRSASCPAIKTRFAGVSLRMQGGAGRRAPKRPCKHHLFIGSGVHRARRRRP